MRNDRDWRAIDRQRRADDWRYAGEFFLWPLWAIGAVITMAMVGAVVILIAACAVLVRMLPWIVAMFAAIILARCAGVL